MFDTRQIGAKITKLRKSAGITQAELAEQLGISFQAVSNWERGISMPDIAKLGELSALFHVSIDEILANPNAGAVSDQPQQSRPTADVSSEKLEEAAERAPVPNEEPEETFANDGGLEENGAEIDLVTAAPFLSQEFVDRCAAKLFERRQSLDSIAAVAPFVSTDLLDEWALEIVEKTGDLNKVACVAPFLSSERIDEFAAQAFRGGGVRAVSPLAPFMSHEALNRMAAETLRTSGMDGLKPVLPFVDSRILEDHIMNRR